MNYSKYTFSWEGLCYVKGDERYSISEAVRRFLVEEIEMSLDLNVRRFTIKKDDAKRKKISHWVKEGILNENRDGKIGWRKFSFVELLWLKIIEIMRDTGFSIEKIKSVKKSLTEIEGAGSIEYPVLEYGFFCAYHCSDPTFLVVLPNGSAELVYGDDLAFDLSMPHLHFMTSFFTISINGLVGQLFKEPTIYLKVPDDPIPDDKKQLIDFMNEHDFDEVRFDLKNGRINLMEGTMTTSDDLKGKDIQEQLRRHSHQKVEIKQYDFDIKQMQSTIQRKIKD